ncbi:hypothetical protein QMT04_05090 [Cronobacter sakazakii]|uniref:hypothetical protein n=1 Tax=Cronobacter sakazakii TaxID=28141 RepID=UPI000BE92C32|nr:hypothetical protein [Cronobacter sakazakii]AXW96611.2 hypothetical protein CsakCS931_20705 [Cronobacter sakazakii]MDK1064035.1 hypothetical protein [Cronobacter sakazakii]PQX76481.1 hypothetical protein C5975_09445 [Cronobacter sakazakii]PQY55344.1 hypothetical protein C5954_17830 [Cronobacter sakazakii]PUV57409.1 hypothetical protein CDT88_02975 [Cronobacter sakazakii]
MKINVDVKNKIIKLGSQDIKIPDIVVETLSNSDNLTSDTDKELNKFLKKLNIKRIGFNGLTVGDYYEFIFKVDGDGLLDSHHEKYEVITKIDNIPVRIGSLSDFAILVICCKNPFLKDDYVNNNTYHYISISFSSKPSKLVSLIQCSKFLVNRTLSNGNSFIIPDDIFKPYDSTDEDNSEDDFMFRPSLTETIENLQNLKNKTIYCGNESKLYELISKSYEVEEEYRFIPYFKVLEHLSRKQKTLRSESKISKYLSGMSIDFKNQVVNDTRCELEYDVVIEYMRCLRNMIVHPNIKPSSKMTVYPIKKMIFFQKILISKITNISL